MTYSRAALTMIIALAVLTSDRSAAAPKPPTPAQQIRDSLNVQKGYNNCLSSALVRFANKQDPAALESAEGKCDEKAADKIVKQARRVDPENAKTCSTDDDCPAGSVCSEVGTVGVCLNPNTPKIVDPIRGMNTLRQTHVVQTIAVKNALSSGDSTCGGTGCTWEDNGDGTATDLTTGLQWMQSPAPGTFSIGSTSPPYTSDGTAYTVALNDLNGGLGACFANYCDWRLPTAEELLSLIANGRMWPTPLLGSRAATWSSTSDQDPKKNLLVDLTTGEVIAEPRDANHVVRAVRKGLVATKNAPSCGSPDDSSVGGRCVFVTSKVTNGNLGGLAGADEFCNQVATVRGLPGTYVAWLSDDNTDARDRLPADGPFKLVTGEVVAGSVAELLSGTLNHAIDTDEWGAKVPLREVWTDSSPAGYRQFTNCNNWTSDTSVGEYGLIGWNTATSSEWTEKFLQFCDRNNVSLYCIQKEY
ncbi:MAG TPA: DUF1566 domain-containing protein [Candidatus Binatia bacterium]|jgi:hypothetical protein